MNAHPRIASYTPTSSAGSIVSRAMVISLTTSSWSGRVLDRKVTAEINRGKGAANDAGRFNKLLIPADALDDIQSVINETQAEFRRRTLPWVDAGAGRILAADTYLHFCAWFRQQEGKLTAKRDDFLRIYPSLVQMAPARLSGMFDHTDYPTVDQLRGKFGMLIKPLPAPDPLDFRAAVSEAQARHIRAEIEETIAAATANAVRDVYERIADKVGRMAERLNAYRPHSGAKGDRAEGTFKDTLVSNIRELIDVLPSLNITGDPALAEIGDRLRGLVEFDAEVLRKSEGRRKDVAAQAQDILNSIEGFLA